MLNVERLRPEDASITQLNEYNLFSLSLSLFPFTAISFPGLSRPCLSEEH